MLINEAIRSYYDYGMKSFRPPTQVAHHRALLRFSRSVSALRGSINMEALDVAAIDSYVETIRPPRLARSTFNNYQSVLRRFLSYCVEEGWISSNPLASTCNSTFAVRSDRAATSTVNRRRCQMSCSADGDPFLLMFSARGVVVQLCPEHASPLVAVARRGKAVSPMLRVSSSVDALSSRYVHEHDAAYGLIGRWFQR